MPPTLQAIPTQKFRNLKIAFVGTDSQGDTLSADTLHQFVEQIRSGGCFLTVNHCRTTAPLGRFSDARVLGEAAHAELRADGVLYGTKNYCALGEVIDRFRPPPESTEPSRLTDEDDSPIVVRVASTNRLIADATAKVLRSRGVRVEVGRELKKGLVGPDTLTIIIGGVTLLAPVAAAALHKFVKSALDGFVKRLGKRVGTHLADESYKLAESFPEFLSRLFEARRGLGKGPMSDSNIDLVFRVCQGYCQVDAVIPSGTPSAQIPDAIRRMAARLLTDATSLLRPKFRSLARRIVFTWEAGSEGWVPAYIVFCDTNMQTPASDLVAARAIPAPEDLGRLPIAADGTLKLSMEALEIDVERDHAAREALDV